MTSLAEKRDATRKDIAAALPPGCKFSIRYIGFEDLVRDHAYTLRVVHSGEPVPTGVLSTEIYEKHKAVYEAMQVIKKTLSWKGKHLLTG